MRLWASNRGQTLARAVAGVTQYGAAVRLLAWAQLEVEYAREELVSGAPLRRVVVVVMVVMFRRRLDPRPPTPPRVSPPPPPRRPSPRGSGRPPAR